MFYLYQIKNLKPDLLAWGTKLKMGYQVSMEIPKLNKVFTRLKKL